MALNLLRWEEGMLAGERGHLARSRALDFAIGEVRAMKMQPALERALRDKGLLSA